MNFPVRVDRDPKQLFLCVSIDFFERNSNEQFFYTNNVDKILVDEIHQFIILSEMDEYVCSFDLLLILK